MNSVHGAGLGGRNLPAEAPPTLIQFVKGGVDGVASLQLAVLPVEQQGGPGILCAVVGPLLDAQT